MNLAGLQMIAAHAQQFSQFIFEDCINIFQELKGWVSNNNRDMQKLGRDAIIAVLKVVCSLNFIYYVYKFKLQIE